MKRYLFILLSIFLTLPTLAQQEEDFASSFMKLNDEEVALACMTVSPSMMERVLLIPDDSIECDSLRPLLEQIKSVRVVSGQSTNEEVALLYGKAEVLAQYHPLGYEKVAHNDESAIYLRRRAEHIVEIVLIMQGGNKFCMIDLTGNMTDDFLSRLNGGETPK